MGMCSVRIIHITAVDACLFVFVIDIIVVACSRIYVMLDEGGIIFPDIIATIVKTGGSITSTTIPTGCCRSTGKGAESKDANKGYGYYFFNHDNPPIIVCLRKCN